MAISGIILSQVILRPVPSVEADFWLIHHDDAIEVNEPKPYFVYWKRTTLSGRSQSQRSQAVRRQLDIVDLTHANLSESLLIGTKLLSHTDHSILDASDLQEAELTGASLNEVSLLRCNLNNAKLELTSFFRQVWNKSLPITPTSLSRSVRESLHDGQLYECQSD